MLKNIVVCLFFVFFTETTESACFDVDMKFMQDQLLCRKMIYSVYFKCLFFLFQCPSLDQVAQRFSILEGS